MEQNNRQTESNKALSQLKQGDSILEIRLRKLDATQKQAQIAMNHFSSQTTYFKFTYKALASLSKCLGD